MSKFVSRVLSVSLLLIPSYSLNADWPTFGHHRQRSGLASDGRKLTVDNVKGLELKWSIQRKNIPLALSALTRPVVAQDVMTPTGIKTLVYVAGSSNHLFAVDASAGTVVWQRTFQSFVNAKAQSFYLGLNAASARPVIDRQQNITFALAYNGRLFGLDLGKLLYQRADAMKTWNHFGGLAIDNGKVYSVNHSSPMHRFGVRTH